MPLSQLLHLLHPLVLREGPQLGGKDSTITPTARSLRTESPR